MLARGLFTSDSGHSLLHGLGPCSALPAGSGELQLHQHPPVPLSASSPWGCEPTPPSPQPPYPHLGTGVLRGLRPSEVFDQHGAQVLSGRGGDVNVLTHTPKASGANFSAPKQGHGPASGHGHGGAGRPGRGEDVCHLPVQHPEPTASSPRPPTQAESHLRWPRTRRTRR